MHVERIRLATALEATQRRILTSRGLASPGAQSILNVRKQESADHAISKVCSTVSDANLRSVASDFETRAAIKSFVQCGTGREHSRYHLGLFDSSDLFNTDDENRRGNSGSTRSLGVRRNHA